VPLDFGSSVLGVAEVWLEVAVRRGKSQEAYTVLSPRQKLTSTPYAIFAQQERWSLIGVPVGFVGKTDKDTVTDVTKVPGDEKAAAQAGSSGWTDTGSVVRLTTATDTVSIGTASPGKKLSVNGEIETSYAGIYFGGANRDYNFGVGARQSDSMVYETWHWHRWIAKGTGEQADQQEKMTLAPSGNLGIGTRSPQAKLHIERLGFGLPVANIRLAGSELTDNYDGVLRLRSGGSIVAFDGGDKVGIGTIAPRTKLDVQGAGDEIAGWFQSRGNDTTLVVEGLGNGELFKAFGSNGGGPEFRILNDGSVELFRDNAVTTLRLDAPTGRVTSRVVEITGGADVSEQFEVNGMSDSSGDASPEQVQPGMVVSINPNNPGKLIVSSRAYDHRVAGIISGAGGVQPGMLMSQSGSVADGRHPVALTGRVYCWADATNGPIKPGDLLTSSDTPGHAMKVRDHKKAQGAIIGKAMTELKQGKGLVLVLVTLQ
jgi:hypothetical protein